MTTPPKSDPERTIREAASYGSDANTESLDRFPAVFSSIADIPKHQLGWRMAVVPFRAADPASEAIAFGMAEEISAAISRFRSPRLIAPATFWDGSGPAVDVLGRCKTYELDYMMEGSIHVTGTEIRIDVTLLDVVLDFEVIWTGRFTGTMDDLFSVQHQVAAETVGQLDPDLYRRGPVLAAPIETSIPAAHHHVLAAIQGIYNLDRQKFVLARASLTEAIVLDPGYAAAYAWLGYWSIMAVGFGCVDDARHVIVLAGIAADRAIDLDPCDARAIAIAGHVKAYLQHDVQSALDLHARAVELNPNLPIAWALSSASKMYNGEHLTAIRHASISRSLSPRDPHLYYTEHNLTWAHFFRRDLRQAEMLSEAVLAINPDHVSAINVHLAILGHLGRAEESALWLARLRLLNPDVCVAATVARAPWQKVDQSYYADGLRLSGVPEW